MQDHPWGMMDAGININMDPLLRYPGTSHGTNDAVTETISQFFGYNPIDMDASLIPTASGFQPDPHTPPPMPDMHTQEDEIQYGRGHRVPIPRDAGRLSSSGRRQRPTRPRRH